MNDIQLEKLFDIQRLPRDIRLFFICLYFPIGFILAVIRFFIGLQVYFLASIIPKQSILRRLILRPMLAVMGIWIRELGIENKTSRCKVFVANYTTQFDYVPIQIVQSSLIVSTWDFSDLVILLLGYHDLGAKHGRETLIMNAKKHIEESNLPLLTFPEAATTNSKVGLLKFSVWPFSLDETIQPIAVRLSRPNIFHISMSLLHSHFIADFFWFLFVPYTIYTINFLPVVKIEDDENPLEFCKRVQKIISQHFGLKSTNYTCADKTELAKRSLLDRKHAEHVSQKESSEPPSEIDYMANQVKEVLGNVPFNVIKRDLALTKDIDLTITNIIEGRVEFQAEEPGVEADREVQKPKLLLSKLTTPTFKKTPGIIPGGSLLKEAIVKNSATINQNENLSPSMTTYSSSTFGKTSEERQLSFKERKDLMIEMARKKYSDKIIS